MSAYQNRGANDQDRSNPHRPIFHFVAPGGSANPFDPNGAIEWNGLYHLGFIDQRQAGDEVQHVWGHAVSTDLLHWRLLPDMLSVGPEDDENGIFSGAAFVSKEGVPHLIYHAWGAQANRIARAADKDLSAWVKLRGRTTLTESDPGDPKTLNCCHPPKGRYSVFDPHAWYDENSDSYVQITGGMKPAIFTSPDMNDWTYVGDLIPPERRRHHWYEDLSCPTLLFVADKAILVFISHEHGAQYYIGTFANGRFVPETHGRMNWPGGSTFAAEHLTDSNGRNILWAWLAGGVEKQGASNREALGILSLPRVLSVGPCGELFTEPAAELDSLRLDGREEQELKLHPNTDVTLAAAGSTLELQVEFRGGGRSPYGLKLFASPDGREETIVRYEPKAQELVIDFERSNAGGAVSAATFRPDGYDFSQSPFDAKFWTRRVSQQRAPLVLAAGESLCLRVYLDRSVIEIFANGRQAMTQRAFPELPESVGIRVFSGEEPVAVGKIRSWQMAATDAQ